MRKVAASKVYFSQSEYKVNKIVEINSLNVTGVRDLKHEEPMTEWMTGTVILTNNIDVNPDNINHISDFYSSSKVLSSDVLYAWYVANLDHNTGCILSKNISLIK